MNLMKCQEPGGKCSIMSMNYIHDHIKALLFGDSSADRCHMCHITASDVEDIKLWEKEMNGT